MKKYNILVLGCGGDIGQSIGKILKKLSFINEFHGIDINDKTPSKFIYQKFSIGLACNDENYIQSVEKYVLKNKIDLIIPISEPELRFLNKKFNLTQIGGAKLIMASNEAMNVGFDKYKTALFLKDNGLPFPFTEKIEAYKSPLMFPLIYKSIDGAGSKNIFLLKDQTDFDFYSKKFPENFILQEYIDVFQQEYTCGVFRSKSKEIRKIILKRELHGDYTGYGEVVFDEQIDKLLDQIADKLNLQGSINVQLRLSKSGPIVFEINPRFSSTILFRDLLGFNDLKWSIEDVLGKKLSKYNNSSVGKVFYKGFKEYID